MSHATPMTGWFTMTEDHCCESCGYPFYPETGNVRCNCGKLYTWDGWVIGEES